MSEHVRSVFRSWLTANSPAPYVETVGRQLDLNQAGAEWVTLEFPIVQAQRVSLGYPACFRETGEALIHCFARSGQGDAAALALAEAIRPRFAGPYVDDVRFLSTSPPQIVPTDSGEWIDAVVQVSYTWDYIVEKVTP